MTAESGGVGESLLSDTPRATVLLLGDVGIGVGGRFFGPRSTMSRVLLAVLALESGRVVGDEALIRATWGDRPPDSRSAVAVAVYRLRQWLREHAGESVEVLRAPNGYLLRLDGQTDVERFRSLTAVASSDMDAHEVVAALEEALRCWRGPALADVPDHCPVNEKGDRLNREKLGVTIDLSQALLRIGKADAAARWLEPMAANNPMDEPVHCVLMEALTASGRQAEALDAYQRIRERLADEFGVDPGQHLQEVYLRVLRQQVPESAPADRSLTLVPAQLPSDVVGFTGRLAQLSELNTMLAGRCGSGAAIMCSIVGTAGVGKTALAVHWAHMIRDQYPDGQLYVNLRGYSDDHAVAPSEAVAQFLRSLGVPAEEVPLDVHEAAAMYRSLLADRRVLVLLDNAADAEQTRLLRPGGPGCLVVTTSRERLTSLIAMEGAQRLVLDVLSVKEAVDLITQTVGVRRTDAEPTAASQIAKACARLPLALRVAAANLVNTPHQRLGDYVTQLLNGDRLTLLDFEGEEGTAVRSTFDLSYRRLGLAERRMFRLLGLIPGPDVSLDGAAALAGMTVTEAGRVMNRLVATHMVDRDLAGRFSLHDLLKAYARELAHDNEPVATAMERLLCWYQATTDAAIALLFPEKMRLPVATVSQAFAVRGEGRSEALSWLDTELRNLVEAIRYAALHGPRPLAWRLADPLRGYLELRRSMTTWFTVAELGMAAARSEQDEMGEAVMHLSLHAACATAADNAAAAEHCVAGLAVARRACWDLGEASLLAHLGATYLRLGRPTDAAECVEQAAAIHRRIGNPAGEAVAKGILATIERRLGRLASSMESATRALALYRETGSRNGEARALNVLGNTLRAIGRFDESVDQLTTALAMYRELEDQDGEVCALDCLASAHRDAGRYEQAAAYAQASLDFADEISHERVGLISLNTMGSIQSGLGEYAKAADLHERAVRLARKFGSSADEAEGLIGLGTAYRLLGDPDQPLLHADMAIELSRRDHFRLFEAQALTSRAASRLAIGDLSNAIMDADQALRSHQETGHQLGATGALAILEQARNLASARS